MDVYSTPQYDDFTGFTFNGQHSSQFGLLRVSNGDRYEDTLVLSHSDEAADIPGGPGQYYWGETLKSRTFPVKIAYDEVTEVDKRRIKKWLHPDDKLHELIFDEKPYVKYWVKCTKEVKASELCFKVDGKRVYRGEFDIEFTAYMPYGVAVANTYDSEFITREYYDYSPDEAVDWIESSGLLSTADFAEKGINKFVTSQNKVATTIYNPGDTETGFELTFTNPGVKTKLTWLGLSQTELDSYELLNDIIDTYGEDSERLYIIVNGKYCLLTNNEFPYATFETEEGIVEGQFVEEQKVTKFENFNNGQLHDVYKIIYGAYVGKYKSTTPLDFTIGEVICGVDITEMYYRVYVTGIEEISSTEKEITLTFIDEVLDANSTRPDLYIPRHNDTIVDLKVMVNNEEQEAVEFLIPGAALTIASEWSELQKSLFFNSVIKINTNKKTIEYSIHDEEFGINTDWQGIMGAISKGILFKLPISEDYKNPNTTLEISDREGKLSFLSPIINYTYLYK